MKWLQLQLRDLFWLALIAAIGVSWGWERHRLLREIPRGDLMRLWFRHVTDEPSEDVLARRQESQRLQRVTERELLASLVSPTVAEYGHLYDQYHLVWLEMARRGMGEELQELLDKENADQGEQFPPIASLYTALCRAERKPDPLAIEVELPGRTWEGTATREPWVIARLKNVDVDGGRVSLFEEGGYGNGRRESWRVELTDMHGHRCSDANFTSFPLRHGLPRINQYEFGEISDAYWLDARKYSAPPKSGHYTLQLTYSAAEIANESDLTGLIVWRSTPITVLVENDDEKKRQRAMIPPLVVLTITSVAWVVVTVNWIWARAQSSSARRTWKTRWRDGFALVLVLSLSLGWLLNIQQLRKKLHELEPHAKTNWTMRLAG